MRRTRKKLSDDQLGKIAQVGEAWVGFWLDLGKLLLIMAASALLVAIAIAGMGALNKAASGNGINAIPVYRQ